MRDWASVTSGPNTTQPESIRVVEVNVDYKMLPVPPLSLASKLAPSDD